jgi:hypothetical protein
MASERLSKACDCNFLIIVDICITFIHKYLLRNKQFGNMALLMRSCAQQIKAKNHFCLFLGGGGWVHSMVELHTTKIAVFWQADWLNLSASPSSPKLREESCLNY